jgi:isocitrate dehydrogenase
MKIAVAKGDGIGPEIMEAVLKIFDANNVGLEYEYVDMGKWVFDKGFSNGMTPEAQNGNAKRKRRKECECYRT